MATARYFTAVQAAKKDNEQAISTRVDFTAVQAAKKSVEVRRDGDLVFTAVQAAKKIKLNQHLAY